MKIDLINQRPLGKHASRIVLFSSIHLHRLARKAELSVTELSPSCGKGYLIQSWPEPGLGDLPYLWVITGSGIPSDQPGLSLELMLTLEYLDV